MPIYEYRCQDCGARTQVLTISVHSAIEVKCRRCGGPNLKKLVSRVAILKSEESRLENLADPSSLGGVDERDPRSVARCMKRMGREMGEGIGEEFEEEVDRAVEESGGDPSGPDSDMGPSGEDDL